MELNFGWIFPPSPLSRYKPLILLGLQRFFCLCTRLIGATRKDHKKHQRHYQR